MCIVTYSDCPGCYGLHNNQLLRIERCPRMLQIFWGWPDRKGKFRPRDDGPCKRALHVQQSHWDTEEYANHKHIPGLMGQLLPPRHATLKFTGRLSDLELVPTHQEVEESLEDEEPPTEEEWTRVLTQLAGYSETPNAGSESTNMAGDSGGIDDMEIGFSGPPIDFFQKCRCYQNAEDCTKDPYSHPEDECPHLADRWSENMALYPVTPAPAPSSEVEDTVEVHIMSTHETDHEVEPRPLPSPEPKPKPTKRKYTKRKGVKRLTQQPSPPSSPPLSAAKEVNTKNTKENRMPTAREKKEGRRRGRPLGVKNRVPLVRGKF